MVLKVIENYIPIGHPNRPGIKMISEPLARICHGTSNYNRGAGDELHHSYVGRKYIKKLNIPLDKYEYFETNGSPFRVGCTHVYIDADSATIVIPLDEYCPGAGDRPLPYDNVWKGQKFLAKEMFDNKQNYCTWQFELCMNNMAQWDKVLENSIEFILKYMPGVNIPILRHYDVTSKLCPIPFVDLSIKEVDPRWIAYRKRLTVALLQNRSYKKEWFTHTYRVNPLDLSIHQVNSTGLNLTKQYPNFVDGAFYWWKDGKHYPIGWLISHGKVLNHYDGNASKPNGTFIVFKNGKVMCKTMTRLAVKMLVPDIYFCIQGFNLFKGDHVTLKESIEAEGFKYDEVGRTCWRPTICYNPTNNFVYVVGRPNSNAERAATTATNLKCTMGLGLDAGKSASYVHDGIIEIASNEILDNIICW
jgi:hypothetical protein